MLSWPRGRSCLATFGRKCSKCATIWIALSGFAPDGGDRLARASRGPLRATWQCCATPSGGDSMPLPVSNRVLGSSLGVARGALAGDVNVRRDGGGRRNVLAFLALEMKSESLTHVG